MPTSSTKQSGFWLNVKEIAVLLLIVFLIRTFGFGLYQVPTGSMETTMLTGERFFADKLTPLFTDIKRSEIISMNAPTYPYSKNPIIRLWQDYVWGPSNWTKRVIGAPGDHVQGRIENGVPVVYLNGKKLDEPYINKYPLVKVWTVAPRKGRTMFRTGHGDPYILKSKSYDPKLPDGKKQFYRVNWNWKVTDPEFGPPIIYPGTPIYPKSGVLEPSGTRYWSGSDIFDVKLGNDEFWLMGDNRGGSTDSRWFGPVKRRLIHGRIIFRIWSIDTDEAWWILDLIKNPIDFWRRVRWGRIFERVR